MFEIGKEILKTIMGNEKYETLSRLLPKENFREPRINFRLIN